MPKPKAGSYTITASEISQYAYCPVSWYLKRSGAPLESPGLVRGIAEHERAGSRLRLVARRERASGIFHRIASLLAFISLILLGWILWMSP
jgi:CRISPR/Cas system-associated exonuclease Cas4 (RecB family)